MAEVLNRVLLVVWTIAACYELWLFWRGWCRNWKRYTPLRDRAKADPGIHPGRLVLARARLRRDAFFFAIALVAALISLAAVLGRPDLVNPAISVALTLILVAIGIEGHLSQREDFLVERWNAPRDPRVKP